MCQKKINKFPNSKKEIYNDKYRHTRDRLFGLWFHQIHTKTDIYHTVTHLYISCSYYFSSHVTRNLIDFLVEEGFDVWRFAVASFDKITGREICFFNRKRLSWWQLELADSICQNGVCTQTKKSVFIIRPVSNMSQVYRKYIMRNIDTQETDYSVYSSTRHTQRQIYTIQ
jgi:hypothetical protein